MKRNDDLQDKQPIAVAYLGTALVERPRVGLDPIAVQRQACAAKAKELGAALELEFCDFGRSGRDPSRPGLIALLERLQEEPHVDYLIVHRLDRLTRNLADHQRLWRRIQDAQVKLMSCSEAIDDNPSDRLREGLSSIMADWYSQEHSRRVRAGIAKRKKRTGDSVPRGYKRTRSGSVVIDREAAATVGRAFRGRQQEAA
jgi:DNA invertase Pin-like site-specific DNA recombinase